MMKLALNNRLKKALYLSFFACILLGATGVRAQTITEDQPLTFGQIAITDNSVPRTISILSDGSIISDPEYIFFIDPQRGQITLDGYLPNTTYTVTFSNPTTVSPTGIGTSNFSIGVISTIPAVIMTDGTGSITFNTYAVLTSDGLGGTHTDDLYQGTYNVTVTP